MDKNNNLDNFHQSTQIKLNCSMNKKLFANKFRSSKAVGLHRDGGSIALFLASG